MSLIPIPDLDTVNVVKGGGYIQFCTWENIENTIIIDYVDSSNNNLTTK